MKKSIICLLSMFIAIFVVLTGFCDGVVYAKSDDKDHLKISAKSALLIDYDTGTVIYEKNQHERLPIASMTKLATLSLVFDAIDKGIIKSTDMVNISENAASVGGSTAFLDAGSSYKIEDLIKTVIIASANDSSVALAEHLAGSEEMFVSKMNKLSEKLGLNDTRFENCTGLPHDNHYSSAHDMAEIYKTVCNHELYKKDSKIWMEDFVHPSGRKTGLVNTNRLVKTFDGIEGGKTGYTDAAKFCLTTSAKRGNMRLIGVVIGVSDSKTRFAEMSKLLNFGFANYQNKVVATKEVPLSIVALPKAKQKIEIYAEHDCVKFLPKTQEMNFTTEFKIDENIKAPLNAGSVVGKLYVFDENNMVVEEINLIIKQNVETVGFKETMKKLVERW